jgi:WD40 repeat protein
VGRRLGSGAADAQGPFGAVAFSPDGKQLASIPDKTVKLWGLGSATELAPVSSDKTVKLWDASSGAVLQTLEGHSNRVTSDGKQLVYLSHCD